MKKIFILLIIPTFTFLYSKDYSVTITVESNNIYSINYGSFYVELMAYKYPYGETVLLSTNGYGGQICWEETSYDYYSNQNITSYSDCYVIYNSYVETTCSGCYAKNYSNFEKINSILIPKSLNEIIY